jgi:hypothetical protein
VISGRFDPVKFFRNYFAVMVRQEATQSSLRRNKTNRRIGETDPEPLMLNLLTEFFTATAWSGLFLARKLLSEG